MKVVIGKESSPISYDLGDVRFVPEHTSTSHAVGSTKEIKRKERDRIFVGSYGFAILEGIVADWKFNNASGAFRGEQTQENYGVRLMTTDDERALASLNADILVLNERKKALLVSAFKRGSMLRVSEIPDFAKRACKFCGRTFDVKEQICAVCEAKLSRGATLVVKK